MSDIIALMPNQDVYEGSKIFITECEKWGLQENQWDTRYNMWVQSDVHVSSTVY